MTSEELQQALEQNRKNIKALLDAVGADYEFPDDPEKTAKMGAFFGNTEEYVKDAEMTPHERAAWMFEQNAKAIAAAADAAGAQEVTTPTVRENGLDMVAGTLGDSK